MLTTYSLADDEDFLEIFVGPDYYFKAGNFPTSAPYTQNGNVVNLKAKWEMEADGAFVVNLDTSKTVVDSHGNVLQVIIGNRPPKRPR